MTHSRRFRSLLNVSQLCASPTKPTHHLSRFDTHSKSLPTGGTGMMRRCKTIICLAAFLLLMATAAAADTIDYTVTGGFGSITFSLDSNPTPCLVSSNLYFEICSVTTSAGPLGVYFLNTNVFDGGVDVASSSSTIGDLQFGPQLYSGSESSPTMLTGTFQFTGGTVVATDVSQVPEPSSMVLLGTGILSLAGAVRRRMKC